MEWKGQEKEWKAPKEWKQEKTWQKPWKEEKEWRSDEWKKAEWKSDGDWKKAQEKEWKGGEKDWTWKAKNQKEDSWEATGSNWRLGIFILHGAFSNCFCLDQAENLRSWPKRSNWSRGGAERFNSESVLDRFAMFWC